MNRLLLQTGHQALPSRIVRTMSKAFATQDFYRHGLRSLSADNNASGTMEKAMQRLGSIALQPMPGPSNFVKPQSVMYDMDGKQRRWDVVQSHSSVGIVVFHKELNALVLVYATHLREAQAKDEPNPPLSVGFSHELCAGIIDKDKSLEEIAHEEVLEETGYSAPAASMQPVVTYTSAVGVSGSTHHMFACQICSNDPSCVSLDITSLALVQVDESMRSSSGGGLADAGEAIEVLALPLINAEAFMQDTSVCKSAGLLYGLQWLLRSQWNK